MTPPIFTPDGTEVEEVILPDGSKAFEVIAPDGTVVFVGDAIPDSVVNHYDATEDERSLGDVSSVNDLIGEIDLQNGTQFELIDSGISSGRSYELDGINDHLEWNNGGISPPFTWFTVVQVNSDHRGTVFDKGGGGTSDTVGGVEIREGNWEWRVGYNGVGEIITISASLNEPTLLVGYVDSDGDANFRVHDPNLTTNSEPGDYDGWPSFVDVGRDDRDQRYFDGLIGEIALANDGYDDDPHLQSFEDDLLNKWGIE